MRRARGSGQRTIPPIQGTLDRVPSVSPALPRLRCRRHERDMTMTDSLLRKCHARRGAVRVAGPGARPAV